MQRSDKEVTDPSWLEAVLGEAQFCHLALCDRLSPYVIPMNFVYSHGHLLLHSALEGEKMRIIRQNPKVSFCVESRVELKISETPCGYSMRFKSVCGHGIARCVEDPEEKSRLLRIFAMKFISGPLPVFPPEVLSQVMVIDVEIQQIVGKNSGYPAP